MTQENDISLLTCWSYRFPVTPWVTDGIYLFDLDTDFDGIKISPRKLNSVKSLGVEPHPAWAMYTMCNKASDVISVKTLPGIYPAE